LANTPYIPSPEGRGFTAFFGEGSQGHQFAGQMFVIFMLITGACGSSPALMKQQTHNVFAGLLTLYLIATAWLTVRRRENETGLFDCGALLMALAIGGTLLVLGVMVLRGQAAIQKGVPVGMYLLHGYRASASCGRRYSHARASRNLP
jgi:hypothetical protein